MTIFRLIRSTVPAVVLLVALSGCDLFASADTRVSRAEELIDALDFRTASIELKNALQAEPENSRARRLLAEVSLQLGDAPSAETDLRRAVEYGEPAAEVAELASRIKLALGQNEALLTAIDAGEYPLAEPERSLYRGRGLLGLQRFSDALIQFEQVLAQDARSSAALIGAAEAEAGSGLFDLALQRLEGLLLREPDNVRGWLVRGTLLTARGQFDPALEALEKASSLDAGQLAAQEQAVLLGTLIEVHLSRGEVAKAESNLVDLARIFPGAPLTRFLGARVALVRQNYGEAATELQRIVTAAPSFTSARFLLGAVSLAQGRLQQADLHLSQVVQSSPENMEARKLLAQVRMRLDRPDEAVQVLVPALETGGVDPQVNNLLEAAQQRTGSGGDEIPALERALAANPGNTQLSLNLAVAHLRDGEPRKAKELLNTAASRRGGTLRDALNIAAIAADEGAAAADAELSRLLRSRPDDVEVLNLAAGLLTQRAEFDRARALLVNALTLAPGNASTLLGLARLETAAGNLPVARGYLEKLLGLDAGNVPALLGLADLALRQGDAAGAISRMEDWRNRDPGAPEPRFRLARLYLLGNQLVEAKAVLDEAVSGSPDPAESHNLAGSLYLETGRYEQAIASFRSAVEARSDQPVYLLNLAQAHLALDQRPAAREAVGRVLTLRPDWVPAVGLSALLDLREGNRQGAISRVRALREMRPRDAAVHVLEGDLHLAMQQYGEAVNAFDRAFSLRPDAAAALKSYRARFQGRLGDIAQPLLRWLAQQPGDFAVRSVLAEAYQVSGQRIRAIQEYEIVVRDASPNAVVLNNLAWLYQLQRDRRAIETAQRAYQLAPTAAPIADTYGWILVQNNRPQDGLPLLEQAAKAAPNIPEIAYHRAAALAQLGRRDEARSILAALLGNNAEFESRADAQRLLAGLGGG